MTNSETLCHCGKPLHYTDQVIQRMVENLIQQLGETVIVTLVIDGKTRSWKVPRHYLALHGIKGRDVPDLGFEEILEQPWRPGDPVRVRRAGGPWINGRVELGSDNGKSLALALEEPLGAGVFAVHPEFGFMALLLAESEGWKDVQSGSPCELERTRR